MIVIQFFKNLMIYHFGNLSERQKASFLADFRKTDKIMAIVLFVYFVMVSGLTSLQYGYYKLGLIGGGIIFAVVLVTYLTLAGTLISRFIMATAHMAFFTIAVQQSNGLGEGHFILFISVTILVRYKDWIPILTFLLQAAVYHMLLTYCQYAGLELFGTELLFYSWGEETPIGLFAPLLYHVVIVLIAFTTATYYIAENNVRFAESLSVEAAVRDAYNGDITTRITNGLETDLVKQTNTFFKMLNDTCNNMKEISEKLTRNTVEFEHSSKHLSDEAQHQKNEVNQVTVSLNEMATVTRSIAENAEETSSSSRDCVATTNKGMQQASEFKSIISELVKSIDVATKITSDIEQRGQEIHSIVSTIRDIAEQTNLLALNAAIEAARAGEQGRGFAVVADEVRILSQRTHDSTEEISKMIDTFQTTSSEAVGAMNKVHELADHSEEGAENVSASFRSIAEDIHHINQQIAQIASAVEQQSTTNNELTANSERIDQTSVSFSEEAHDIRIRSDELKQLAHRIGEMMQQFKLS